MHHCYASAWLFIQEFLYIKETFSRVNQLLHGSLPQWRRWKKWNFIPYIWIVRVYATLNDNFLCSAFNECTFLYVLSLLRIGFAFTSSKLQVTLLMCYSGLSCKRCRKRIFVKVNSMLQSIHGEKDGVKCNGNEMKVMTCNDKSAHKLFTLQSYSSCNRLVFLCHAYLNQTMHVQSSFSYCSVGRHFHF